MLGQWRARERAYIEAGMRSVVNQVLKWMPHRVHQLALTCAQKVRACLPDRLLRTGCAMIVENGAGEILLVRHTYVEPESWMLPTGSFSGREWPLALAERELLEEIGIEVGALAILEWEDTHFWGRRYQTYIVSGKTDDPLRPDGREIAEAAFFALTDLPPSINQPSIERLDRWRYRRSFDVAVPAFVRPQYLEEKALSLGGECAISEKAAAGRLT